MNLLARLCCGLFCLISLGTASAQTAADSSTFKISMEYRPRTELRNGYRQLPATNAKAAFLTSHRARIKLDFSTPNFRIFSSLQDIRIWGAEDTRDATGDAQFAEFYVEPTLSKNLKIRVGRQQFPFDNQRLFALNNWRQAGGRHDAVRLMLKESNLDTDLILAFNQNKAVNFGTLYDPGFDFYKVLITHYFSWKISKNWQFTGINYADGYQNASAQQTFFKYTNGGKLAWKNSTAQLNFGAWYQHGKIQSGERIRAYLIDADFGFVRSSKHKISLGLQVFSGEDDPSDGFSRAFLAQYGAFHKFNGRMDYTERTVRTYNHGGIFNPYLIQDFKLGKKTNLIWESHLLGTSTPIAGSSVIYEGIKELYAWENDLRFIYKPNSYTSIEAAYLFMAAGEQLQYLPAGLGGDSNKIPQFLYLEITWTPVLFSHKTKWQSK
jgi:hypothetical protein